MAKGRAWGGEGPLGKQGVRWMGQGTGTLALLVSSQEGVGGGQLPHHGVPRRLGAGEVCSPPPLRALLPPPINGGTSAPVSAQRNLLPLKCGQVLVSPCLVAFVYKEEIAIKKKKKKGENKV